MCLFSSLIIPSVFPSLCLCRWFLAVADGPASPRQSHTPALASALAACWDSYSEAFLSAKGDRQVLGEVLRDGVGLLGLWVLFLCVACPVQIMTVPGQPHETQHQQAFQRYGRRLVLYLYAAFVLVASNV
jgi:hypothetical protein